MIDSASMEEFVQSQIRSAVDELVSSIVSDETWLRDLESRIIKHVQDRITSRFSNISVMPDLVDSIKTSVQALMTNGHVPGISQYIDEEIILRRISQSVEIEIQKNMDALILDPVWVAKIDRMVQQSYMQKFNDRLHQINWNEMIAQHIDSGVERWQEKLRKDFRSTGITDNASETRITVLDDGVVTNVGMAMEQAMVQGDATIGGKLQVCDLDVSGSINGDSEPWRDLKQSMVTQMMSDLTQQWRESLIDEVLELAKDRGIDFADITIKGEPLVTGDRLNPAITKTNVRSLGILDELRVSGPASMAETLHVANNRTGINTDKPEMALSVWDEEISVIVGKHSKGLAFVGTSRSNDLAIGTNKQKHIVIDQDGLVTLQSLRVDRWRIRFERQVPGYSGTRGDIVFNCDPKPNTPFAWVCLGGFQWQNIKAQ